jgi:hypothetical protein
MIIVNPQTRCLASFPQHIPSNVIHPINQKNQKNHKNQSSDKNAVTGINCMFPQLSMKLKHRK